MEDAEDTLPLTFDEWEKNAESERAAARREGVVMIPVFLDPAEFFSFCKEKKVSPSTGHLILASRLLGLPQTDFQKSFEISPNRTTAAEFASSRGAASYSLGM